MFSNPKPQPQATQPTVYQIRVRNHLDQQWTDWFSGMSITFEDDGVTVLTGPVADQAALHGLLKKIRDVGLPLVSVNQVPMDGSQPSRSEKEKE